MARDSLRISAAQRQRLRNLLRRARETSGGIWHRDRDLRALAKTIAQQIGVHSRAKNKLALLEPSTRTRSVRQHLQILRLLSNSSSNSRCSTSNFDSRRCSAWSVEDPGKN